MGFLFMFIGRRDSAKAPYINFSPHLIDIGGWLRSDISKNYAFPNRSKTHLMDLICSSWSWIRQGDLFSIRWVLSEKTYENETWIRINK